jgi:hypothetical protein
MMPRPEVTPQAPKLSMGWQSGAILLQRLVVFSCFPVIRAWRHTPATFIFSFLAIGPHKAAAIASYDPGGRWANVLEFPTALECGVNTKKDW